MRKRVSSVELLVLVISLIVYVALAFRMTEHWQVLGDEPHYLLAAHSLVVDHDLDLANNYAQGDFQDYLAGETLDPHVKILPNGTQILNHDLGLPFVLALPYALGGRLGVELFLAFCATLLAWQMYKLAFAVTANPLWSAVSTFALAFTPPLVLYATLIYPEALGALIFVWCARTILFRPLAALPRWQLFLLALAIAFLPWLSVRFMVLLTLLVVFLAIRGVMARQRVVGVYAFVGLGLICYLLINNIVLAGAVPPGSPTELAGGNLATLSINSLERSLIGWWLDPQRGTLIMAPVYVLALAGIPRLFRLHWRLGLVLVSPLLVLVPLVALLGGFWIPFEVGARYFVVAFPLLSAPLALALKAGFASRTRWQRLAFGGFVTLLLGLSVSNGALMITDASYAYGSVVTAYSRLAGSDLSPYFAGMGRGLVVTPRNTPPADGGSVAVVQEQNGELLWHVPVGSVGTVIQSFDLTELTVGHYVVEFRARAEGGDTDAQVLGLELYSAEGLPLVHSTWRVRDLDAASLRQVALEFNNPYFDRWGFPLTLQMSSTGRADLLLSTIYFDPNNPTTWLRAVVWVLLVLTIVLVLNLDWLKPQSSPRAPGGLHRA